ncbi:MAG: hypothetical protein HKN43_04965 [Rhodothermales bacterium]|nr:hypothetical protein [Rhodothermales bacterium]
MTTQVEGYVFHSYGDERFLRHAVAAVDTLRRYDVSRPTALYCTKEHIDTLKSRGLHNRFTVVRELPEENQSIVGFKHNLDRFMPFDKCLFVDSDIVWCKNPDPLWKTLSGFTFTATGHERSDFFFGGPKSAGVLVDIILDRRRRTMRRFGLTHLPRIQAGLIYAQDQQITASVCKQAREYLSRSHETHFRSRLDEGRAEESCEWSLAMAMSYLMLPIFPWYQGSNSAQLDFVEDLTSYDKDFRTVKCRYYSDRMVNDLRGIPFKALRVLLTAFFASFPGKGDHQLVTPYILHFGWLHQKQPFFDFADRVWNRTRIHELASVRDREDVLRTVGASS